MELTKTKFKQTEVGLIPEDWEVLSLGEFSKSYSGGTPSSSVREYYIGNIPWITSSELNKRRITQTEGYISELGLHNSSAKIVEKGTFLLAMYGATAGISAVTQIEGAINQAVLAIKPSILNSEYLLHYFELNKDTIINTYTQGGQPNLSGHLVRRIKLPFPPALSEQKAIASALSDVDELIAKLEKLIEKKKAIKQGAMQALLTPPHKGGKRLEGFSGDWVEKRLGDIATFYSGGTPSSMVPEYYNGVIPWISSGELNSIRINETSGFISQLGLDNSSAKMVKKGTLLLAMYGATAGVCAITNIDGAINQAVLAIIPINYSSEYLFQFLRLNKEYIIKTFTQGGQPNLSGHIVKEVKAFIPNSIEEQNAISKVLYDIDLSIQNIEDNRKKLLNIKQGMMQELLTGRTRLV